MKNYDHRDLAKSNEIFSQYDEIGAGLPIYSHAGAQLRFLLESYCRKLLLANGYRFLSSPHIGKAALWEVSGHLDHYQDSMYAPLCIDGESYYLKPMNCPFHMAAFARKQRSYRELPLRFAEFGMVYRYERSGSLHGLARVRGFTQDDAHIFCEEKQAKQEIINAIQLSCHVLKACRMPQPKIYLASRPKEKSLGSNEDWVKAESILKEALQELHLHFEIDNGGGAFYGPKIDFKLSGSQERLWQLSTIQFDFNLPERFQLSYKNSDGRFAKPFVIHRAFFGSLDRFMAVLLEHFGMKLPEWLAPVQVDIAVIDDSAKQYSRELFCYFISQGLRCEISDIGRSELRSHVKEKHAQQIPFLIVIGEREARERMLSLRERDKRDAVNLSRESGVEHVQQKCKEPALL